MMPFPSMKSTFHTFVPEALQDMRLHLEFGLSYDLRYCTGVEQRK